MKLILKTIGAAFAIYGAVAVSEETVSVRTLALREDEISGFYIFDGKSHLPLKFSTVQPSENYLARNANPLPIYRRANEAKGKVNYIISHSLRLPEAASGVLLLSWRDAEKIRFVAIKDEFEKAGFSDWLFINASIHSVAVKVGASAVPLMLHPGISATHQVSAAGNKGVAVSAQAVLKGKTKTFFSTFWPVEVNNRSIVIFSDSNGKILVRQISDVFEAR